MASVWEERFKEEAEKTIPLQEVDLDDMYYLCLIKRKFIVNMEDIYRKFEDIYHCCCHVDKK